jgi:putative heme-binding domain-containing protein
MNCGVWRYHPVKQTFEVVAHGTTNPWGIDFDDTGEMFITNCVIPHLFHVVPGAHFQRMYGQDFNPHLYELMSSCADHIHWGGGDWTSSRGGQGMHNQPGGGHAHAGAMIYQGNNWPERYRNSIFMLNIHGQRVNHDRISRSQSGFIATHEADFLFAHDPWFRGLEMKYGPDGAVYMTDWSDIGECHDYDSVDGVHRENGRVYKISFGRPRWNRTDLASLSDTELVQLQVHANEWYVRHARRLLQERARAGSDMSGVHESLWKLFRAHDEPAVKLRAIWALHVTGGLHAIAMHDLLSHESEYVRAWAVRLVCEGKRRLDDSPGANFYGKFVALANDDPSALVRLHVAAALQRIPLEQRWTIASGLLSHSEDAADRNLTLMYWYGIEPLVSRDVATAAALAARSKIPLIRRFLARRIVLEPDRSAGPSTRAAPGLVALIAMTNATPDAATQLDLLQGMHDTLRGQKKLTMPSGWPSLAGNLSDSPEVRALALLIGLTFGDSQAAASLKETMIDRNASSDTRQWAIQSLVEGGVSDIVPTLVGLLDDPSVRGPAIRALAAFNDAATPQRLLERYGSLSEAERADAIATLASRPSYARELLAGIRDGTVPARDVSPFIARQVQGFNLKEINDELARVWGAVRTTTAEHASLMAKYKPLLAPEQLDRADLVRGRAIFNQTCAQCHRLFGEGNEVGPDLTGSNRNNVDFILENVLDPNAIVGRDYRLNIIATKNGRIISGIIQERTDTALVVQTANERVTLAMDDIDAMKESPASMMPEGIFEKMTIEEIRDLVAYLGAKSQVPLRQE